MENTEVRKSDIVDFEDIKGEGKILEYFSQTVKTGTISHAYLIEGEKGSGKKTLANAFAKLILCEEGGDRPCGHCKSCRMVESGNHPDLITLTHEKDELYTVAEVREQLIRDMAIKPYQGKKKIYIIPDGELMREDSQNTILKTIEEPSEHGVVMILTTNAGLLLQTILSRVIKISVKPVKNQEVYGYLRSHFTESSEDDIRFATEYACGNIGKGVRSLRDEDFMELKDLTLNFLSRVNKAEIHDMVDLSKELATFKKNLNDFFDIVNIWFRDVLLYKETKDKEMLIFKSMAEYMVRQAEVISYENVQKIYDAIPEAKRNIRVNINAEVALENFMFVIKGALGYYK